MFFHLLHPMIIDDFLWQYVTKKGSKCDELLYLGGDVFCIEGELD